MPLRKTKYQSPYGKGKALVKGEPPEPIMDPFPTLKIQAHYGQLTTDFFQNLGHKELLDILLSKISHSPESPPMSSQTVELELLELRQEAKLMLSASGFSEQTQIELLKRVWQDMEHIPRYNYSPQRRDALYNKFRCELEEAIFTEFGRFRRDNSPKPAPWDIPNPPPTGPQFKKPNYSQTQLTPPEEFTIQFIGGPKNSQQDFYPYQQAREWIKPDITHRFLEPIQLPTLTQDENGLITTTSHPIQYSDYKLIFIPMEKTLFNPTAQIVIAIFQPENTP